MSMLQVVVIGATNVPNVEKLGESDPYASIEFKGKKSLPTCKIFRVHATEQNTPVLICIYQCIYFVK